MTGSSSGKQDSVPVAPDSVRVWRGFKLSDLPQEEFFAKLGSFFIPGTVQIQSQTGLNAYLPSVLPADKPAAAPDEIALVFYAYQNAYDQAKETVGGRAYADLHGVAFDLKKSLSGFPIPFTGELVADERYHLFDTHVDWQQGIVKTFVGVPSSQTQDFFGSVAAWLGQVQNQTAGPDAAIASAADGYVVYWEHWADAESAGRSLISELAGIVEPVYQKQIEPCSLGEGLWDQYAGVRVSGGESFNFQFQRQLQDWQQA